MAKSKPFSADFELFWYKYPKRVDRNDINRLLPKVGKQEAWLVWERMSIGDRLLATVALDKLPKSAQWIKDAHRWLSKKGWRDFEPTPEAIVKRTRITQDAKRQVKPTVTPPIVQGDAIAELKLAAAKGSQFAKNALEMIERHKKDEREPAR